MLYMLVVRKNNSFVRYCLAAILGLMLISVSHANVEPIVSGYNVDPFAGSSVNSMRRKIDEVRAQIAAVSPTLPEIEVSNVTGYAESACPGIKVYLDVDGSGNPITYQKCYIFR